MWAFGLRGDFVLKRLFLVVVLLPLPADLCAQACPPPVVPAKTVEAPIGHVTFSNDAFLPPEKEQEIVKQLRDDGVDPNAIAKSVSSLADEAAERVREAFQDDGYFKVQVDAKAIPDATAHLYDIAVQIRNVGRQYRLGDLTVSRATWFPQQQLRDLFSVQRGEVFSSEEIAKGLEELGQLYGSEGFINSTPVPNTEFDDAGGIANLNIDVDEGKQFRLRSVSVLGLDADTEERVLSEIDLKSGDIFDSAIWERSLQKIRELVRIPTLTVADLRLDEENGGVNAVLDFRPCPPISISAESTIPLRRAPSPNQH
jgi:surface antigen-like variable number repeat protein